MKKSEKPRTANKIGTQKPEGAKPGTKDTKAKKEKVVKVSFPGLVDGEGEPVKLKAAPDGWDPKKHKPLKKSDFEDEAVFFDYRALLMDAHAAKIVNQATKLRQMAEDCRKLGSATDRAKARKLRSWMEKAEALKAELEADGIDVSSLMEK